MCSSSGHFLLAVLVIVPAATTGPAQETAAERPPVVFLDAPRRADDGAGPLDWVLDKIDSASDRWRTEEVTERIAARLEALERLLRAPAAVQPFDATEVLALLSPGFEGTRLVPRRQERILSGDLGVAWRGRVDRRRQLDRRAWVDDLVALRGLFRNVETAAIKVFRIDPGSLGDEPAGPGRVTAWILLEVAGADGAGGFAQTRSVWQTEWLLEAPAWRLAAVSVVSFERARADRRPFVDVTDEALAANASYREQLRFGVGWWRTRMDAASGMDIYGHQGISVGDFDNDGLDDFYVPQPAGLPNRLYRNLGDGRFEDATAAAGVDVLDVTGGALFVDLDNDGDRDLVVACALEVLLFENLGNGRFRRRSASGLQAAARRSASTLGCAAADHDLDGDLDLYVFSYVFWAGGGSKRHSSYPYPYHDANNGAPNFLFRNDGNLKFTDVTEASGMGVNNRRFSLAASWADFDDDGDPDLYVANDFGKNNLYVNDGKGKFHDAAVERGVEDVGNGMSVTWEDHDNDGLLDLYVGNMWSSAGGRIAYQPAFSNEQLRPVYARMSRGNSLFRNLGEGRFRDVSDAAGATFGRWAWSSQFVDVDADGFEDLYVVNGFISNEDPRDL